MLERDMEVAVANCPDLFIETGLNLLRRQVVINGRRPDLLFADQLSRHLLVEIQSGRLDEDHLQRHFYYFYDYRAKYPSLHLRLMFIANRIVPQHKQFLDEHGYEFREYPEGEFARRAQDCIGAGTQSVDVPVELVQTPGVLTPNTYEILNGIETQRMVLCYKMLLLINMAECANEQGRVSMKMLAERFQEFFVKRAAQNKLEENPNIVNPSSLPRLSVTGWERRIREQPVHFLTEQFVIDEGPTIRWAPRIWQQWTPELREQIRNAAVDRLVRYFNRNVPGGY